MVLTSGLKKIIGTKAFYKAALAFALPLILQDTVSSFVNLLDNMIIGSLGTEQMSGVAIVNQFINLFTMCIYGGVAGANIFAAQYIGNNDNKNAQHAIRFNFIMVTCFSALFIAVMYLFQDKLISAFLHISSGKGDLQATLQYGKEYLKIMLWQVLPFALATTYAMTLRLGKDSMTPMKASFAALFTNLIFNYLLIFGKLGFPRLGVAGAAIATVISRIVQLGIISVAAHRNTDRFPFLKGLFRSLYIPGELTWSIVLRGLPLLFNQLLLSAGQVLMNQIYSNRGLEAVASMNIVTTVANLFVVIMWSFGNYIAIYTGNLLGNREFDKARGGVSQTDGSFLCVLHCREHSAGGYFRAYPKALQCAAAGADSGHTDAADHCCCYPHTVFINKHHVPASGRWNDKNNQSFRLRKHLAFVHSRRLAAGEVHCIYPAGGVPAGQLS